MSSISSSFLSSYKKPGDLTSPKFLATKEDLLKMLNVLNTAEDNDLQVKTFSILAVYLITKKEYTDVIITNTMVYDKLYLLLTRGQMTVKARILYFISAMLFDTDEETAFTRTKRLVIYAQNMIRNSGCLVAMCDLFLSSMMHQETWKALCRCLAAACHDFAENQTYCSHLVPLCVKKCQQRDIEVMVTLKSLINNHSRNMQLFLECDGLSMFEKEIPQHDTYLQFLDAVVQNTSPETLIVLHKSVIRQLRYFKAEFDLESRIGQWATVILHHFNSRLNELNITEENYKNVLNETKQASQVIQLPNYDETAKLLQNVIREIYQYNANNDEEIPLTDKKASNFPDHNINNYDSRQTVTNSRLFPCEQSAKHKANNQKVALTDKKASNFPNNNINNYDSRQSVMNSRLFPRDQTPKNNTVKPVTEKSFENSIKELSFSFLSKNQWGNHTNYIQNGSISNYNNENRSNAMLSNQSIKERHEVFSDNTKTSHTYHPRQHSKYYDSNKIKREQNMTNAFDFRPTFVSTPKHLKCTHESLSTIKSTQMNRHNRNTFKRTRRQNLNKKRQHCHKTMEETKEHDSIKNRSLSSRLFDAINDSCTTLVKTVTNIFKPKNIANNQTSITTGAKIDPTCNYSFTDYMRKRDAALVEKQTTKSTDESNNIVSCKTCNDTLLLKRKIIDDNYLKETVNKLKVAINLYGCDFKKISRTIWPHESYMTPEVLYNLYRKVILK